MKDCKTSKCYNEVNEKEEFCFDCLNRQAEDKQHRIGNILKTDKKEVKHTEVYQLW